MFNIGDRVFNQSGDCGTVVHVSRGGNMVEWEDGYRDDAEYLTPDGDLISETDWEG